MWDKLLLLQSSLSNFPNDFPLQINRSELPNTQVQSIFPLCQQRSQTRQTWTENIPHKMASPNDPLEPFIVSALGPY
jgi:hypothetical protein